MVYSAIFSPNFIPLSPVKPTTGPTPLHPYFPSIQCKRTFPLSGVASITYPPINVDFLESEFSGHGVTFEDISDSCVVKLGLEDGSVASLMLPSGLITSYKAPMWHGGTLELLHTSVSKRDNGDVLIQGGASLAFTCQSDGGVSWSPNTWALHNVRGNPQQLIQVELVSTNGVDMAEFKHIVTLQEGQLSSELVISNLKSSTLKAMGSLIIHLNVSTPEATYAVGLEGSDFYSRPPILTNFSIIPPEPGPRTDLIYKKFWSSIAVKELLSTLGGRKNKERDREEDMEGEDNENYKHLTNKMSRIYTSAPRYFTVIDRGRRNSIEVGRDGFNELYLFSPGSSHKWYGKYAYICIGQSALLEPILLAPGGEWRGSQHLHNPNL